MLLFNIPWLWRMYGNVLKVEKIPRGDTANKYYKGHAR
jgi:hypothetical protein